MRFIVLLCAMLTVLFPTASMAEWGRQQCLHSAQICSSNCEINGRSCYSQCRNSACRERCGRSVHECIYVSCDSQPCFKLR